MTQAWVIRSGRFGERDSWALTEGCSGGGWREVPNLSPYGSREAVAGVVAEVYGTLSDATRAGYTGQLWALRGRITPGDLMVMPLKTTKQIAIGRVTGGYEYRAHEEDPERRHVVVVDWQRTDLPRSAVKQDLLFTLGSAMSIFSPSKNGALARLEYLRKHGVDPGQVQSGGGAGTGGMEGQVVDVVDQPEETANIAEVALDRITARIAEDFAGHGLATLVTALLRAQGLHCTQSPPGPDGGVDIVAGRGVLGLDDPVLVQVKSGGQVGSPVVSQLQGVMAASGAKQGLLVAWGGLTKPARDTLKTSHLSVRVWAAAEVVDAVLANYEVLSDEIRSQLPLKRAWMLADDGE